MNWQKLWQFVMARAAEKSTWAGVFTLLASVTGWAIAPDMAVQITSAATAIAGIFLMAMKEKGPDQ